MANKFNHIVFHPQNNNIIYIAHLVIYNNSMIHLGVILLLKSWLNLVISLLNINRVFYISSLLNVSYKLMIKVFFVRINLSKRREKKKITTMQASPPANVVYNVSALCCRCTTASEEAAKE
jgi:hypothetical protein